MPNSSSKVDAISTKNASRLIQAMEGWKEAAFFETKPSGMWGFEAQVKCGNVTIKSSELDFEAVVSFDDDLEANEAEIIVYNLSKSTVNQLNKGASISITAGYKGDTGVIFSGFIDRVKTRRDGADKKTTIFCFDDVEDHTISSISFAANTKASYILKSLIGKTGLPLAVFSVRRDHTYENEQTVDGDLMQNIKKYSEVCGVSTYVNKGQVYCRYVKDGDNINFEVSSDTGMIGSPEEFEEEQTAEDFKETVNGFTITMLLQHRMTTAAIINLKSEIASGKYRVRCGKHKFNELEATTEIEVI